MIYVSSLLTLVAYLSFHEAFGSLAGTLGTFAGVQDTVDFAGDGGRATSALFNQPSGVWVDTLGIVYIADQMNFRVRKVDRNGIVTTKVGNGLLLDYGNGGAGTSAAVWPFSLCGDTVGSIFAVDTYMYRIERIDPSSVVSTFAGGGSSNAESLQATSYSFTSPGACSVDTQGNVYVSDYGAYRIKKITRSTKIVTTVAGKGDSDYMYTGNNGPATSASFNAPYDCFLNANFLYSTELIGNSVRRVDITTGLVIGYAGGFLNGVNYAGDGGAATSAVLKGNYPHVTGDTVGNVFYSSKDQHNIRYIGTSGIINRFAGSIDGVYGSTGDGGAATAGLLNGPWQMYYSNGILYVPEEGNNKVRSVSVSTTVTAGGGGGGGGVPTVSVTVSPSLRPSVSPTLIRGTTASPTTSRAATMAPTNAVGTPSVSPSGNTDAADDVGSSSTNNIKRGGVDVTGSVIGVLIAVGFIGLAVRCIYFPPPKQQHRAVDKGIVELA